MTRRFVHAADLHIDSPLRGLDAYEDAPKEELRGATRRAFKNLIELVLTEEAEFLILAGDVFDGEWRDYSTGLFFVNQLGRLAQAGVHVLLVRGNHDAQSAVQKSLQWPPSLAEFVHEFRSSSAETVHLESLGVALHGQSFAVTKVTDDLAADYPAPIPGALNIGVLHTALEGRVGHAPYAPTTAATLVAHGYDYWALGHIHAREIVRESPWIVFPGNLQGRHIRETGAKGASLVSFDAGAIQAVEHRPLDVVRWAVVEVDISTAEDLDEVGVLVEAELGRAAAAAGDRLLAVRVALGGRLSSGGKAGVPLATEPSVVGDRQRELVRELTNHPDRLRDSIRAIGVSIEGARVWIEKVVLDVRVAQAPVEPSATDPRALLRRSLDRMRTDPALLDAGLERCFDRLRTAPRELLEATRSRLGLEFVDSVEALLQARFDEVDS